MEKFEVKHKMVGSFCIIYSILSLFITHSHSAFLLLLFSFPFPVQTHSFNNHAITCCNNDWKQNLFLRKQKETPNKSVQSDANSQKLNQRSVKKVLMQQNWLTLACDAIHFLRWKTDENCVKAKAKLDKLFIRLTRKPVLLNGIKGFFPHKIANV